MRADRRNLLIALAVALVPLALLVRRFDFVCDDAYIAFRYSKNLADGLGLRFNPGTHPPVEGHSTFLWVLWCAIPEALELDTALWARVSLFACSVGMLALMLSFVLRRLRAGLPTALVVAMFYALFPPAAMWSTSGLETMAFALAVFACFERLLGDPERPRWLPAALLAFAATLLRPDGLLWVGMIYGLGLLASFKPGRKELRDAVLRGAALLIVGTAVYVGWRYSYYGDYVPNTARAKVSLSMLTFERGVDYVASFFLNFPIAPLALILGAARLGGRHRELATQAVLIVLGTLGYGVLVGGDFLPMGRFLFPATPFLAILLAIGVQREEGGLRIPVTAAAAAAALVSLLPAFGHSLVPRSLLQKVHYNWNFVEYVSELELWKGERKRVEYWIRLGKALRMHTRPGETLVADSVGAVGYYSDMFLYDQYGLTNREVALREPDETLRHAAGHEKYVRPSFFEKYDPTYMAARLIELDEHGEPAVKRRPNAETIRFDHTIIPLRVEDGFEPNEGLMLARLKESERGKPTSP